MFKKDLGYRTYVTRLYDFYIFNFIEACMVAEDVCLRYKWPGYCTALYGTYQTQGKHICPSAKGSQKVLKYKYNHSVYINSYTYFRNS